MILVNGVVSDAISARDRGVAYGDGVFRTLRIHGGRPVVWSAHYEKLAQDCAALAIAAPDEALLRAEILQAGAATGDCVCKLVITRGTGARGYASDDSLPVTRVVMTAPLPDYPATNTEHGIRAQWCRLQLARQPQLAGIKHLNRLENVLARREIANPGIAEGLLCDTEGHVVGGIMSNVFLVEDGQLVTPALDACGIAGVTRDRVMKQAQAAGLACAVESVSRQRVTQAQELFFVNSLIGVWPVRELDGSVFEHGPVTRRIARWLAEEERAALD